MPNDDFIYWNQFLNHEKYKVIIKDILYFDFIEIIRSVMFPEILELYDYILSLLRLFCKLCKGRNHSSITILKKLGLNKEIIRKILLSNTIDQSLKIGFVELYDVLFVDVEPFECISSPWNRCFVWEYLDKIDLNG